MAAKLVLIVDDQRDVRRILRSGLESLEHDIKVIDVPSGEEAMLVIPRQPIDLLVADIRLPGISGFELVEKAQSRNPNLKYILITGLTEPRIRRRVANSGADAFFFKPIELPDFLDSVQRVLGLVESLVPEIPDEDESGEEVPQPSLSERLAGLHQELGAKSTLLITDLGDVMAQAGDSLEQIEDETVKSALISVFSAATKTSQLLGAKIPKDLLYFPGPKNDLFMIHVGETMALLLVVDKLAWNDEKMWALLRTVRPALDDFLVILSKIGLPVEESEEDEQAAVLPEPEEIVDEADLAEVIPALDEIFSQAAQRDFQPADVDNFWDELTGDEQAGEVTRADVISYDQALQLGLAPEDDE